ncbi:MAG: replicative DNA helicase [Steroidobacteraceae bacterium]|nr:replicative DNA helicase [Steroidobacteraceae bacterium]
MATAAPRRFADGPESLRLPPHSIESEQAVLGSLLLDASAWDAVADLIQAADFYRRDHQLIFEAIAEVVESRGPCDAITVSEALTRRGQVDEVGGLAYLARLAKDTPSAANVRAYAGIVRENALLRALVSAGGAIASSALEAQGRTATELVDEAERKVFEIAERGTRTRAGFQAVKEILPTTIDRIDMLHSNPGAFTGVPTGYTELDRMTTGFQPGDLIIIAGRPSMGKTTLAVNIAENAAIDRGIPAAIFSMEMSAEQVTLRMISSLGRVSQGPLRTGQLSAEDWPRITTATEILSKAPIYIDETPALTPTDMRARARRLKREKGLGLIVVDYLQLMQVAGNKENRATEISEISRSLKALAKELHCPVIALSQLNRSVEQRTEKKPVMSDLRECVVGDTRVCLADGRRVPIRELVGQTPRVLAMDERQKIVAAESDLVWSVGVKPVFRVSLASGRTLTATAQHRVYTGAGWRPVGELQPGARFAVARRMPEVESPEPWPEHELVLLGHLVGDGSYLVHQPLRYTTASESNSEAVRGAAEALGSTVTRHAGRGAWHQLVIGGNGDRWHARGVGAWLKRLGIFGQRSHEKRLPASVFRLPEAQLGLLLRHLWATDGCIHVRKPSQRGAARVYFATSSEGLAQDVAALLLRLGIVARLRTTASTRGRAVHTVDVSGTEQQQLFLDRVGAFGPREAPAAVLREQLASITPNPNADTLPLEAFADVRRAMVSNGVSRRRMASMRGTAYGGTSHFSFAPGRGTLASYAKLLDDDALSRWVESDLFWDRVVAVEPAGEQEVFDLTVPGPASWLADGLVSHNSGAIEQDADLILMIYREEVYEPNTTRKGIADVIITKQRNGPTGEVHLAFLGEYTRFENLVAEAYGEGAFR